MQYIILLQRILYGIGDSIILWYIYYYYYANSTRDIIYDLTFVLFIHEYIIFEK